MNKNFFIEEKSYATLHIENHFRDHDIHRLLKLGILQYRHVTNEYIFKYVGGIHNANSLNFILPKYIANENCVSNIYRSKQIIKILHRTNEEFNSSLELLDFTFGKNETLNDGLVSIALFLLEDYLENGYYSKIIDSKELNGLGEIDWEETILYKEPIIFDKSVVYIDYISNGQDISHASLITLIHQFVLNYFYTLYGDWIDFPPELMVLNGDFDIENLGPDDFLLAELQKELALTFKDREIRVLKSLISTLEKVFSQDDFHTEIYGTKKFHVVWETVCGYIFNNRVHMFKQHIPKPLWQDMNSNPLYHTASLRPDIVTLKSINSSSHLFILDAKYYRIQFTTDKLIGAPSLEDLTKQILYELSLKKTSHEFIVNALLFPENEDLLLKEGDVSENGIFTAFGKITLDFISSNPILLIYLNTEKVYNMFLESKYLVDRDYISLTNLYKM